MGFPTSEAAEEAFYSTFQQGDPEAMREVWATHESIACVHPQGEPLLGQAAVMRSWRGILASGTGVSVLAEPLASSVGANLAIHLVTEKLLDERGEVGGATVATNVYELTDEGWKMLLHHASPQPASAAVVTAVSRQLH